MPLLATEIEVGETKEGMGLLMEESYAEKVVEVGMSLVTTIETVHAVG